MSRNPKVRTSMPPTFGIIALNPAIDCTLRLDRMLKPGSVHAVVDEKEVPGGKGINVARLLAARGRTVRLGGLIGRTDADAFRTALPPSVSCCFLCVDKPTRRNLMLLDGSREYKLNRPGYAGLTSEGTLIENVLARVSRQSDVVILTGSLPQHFPSDTYATMIHRLRRDGKRVVLDASGAALIAGVAAGPDAIKPNREECEHLLGRPCRNPAALRSALSELALRIPYVAISDGPRGAWFAAGGQSWFAASPPARRVDTTAAGDTLLAQWCADLFSRGMDVQTAANAVAAGAAAVETLGSSCPDPARIDALSKQVVVRRLRQGPGNR